MYFRTLIVGGLAASFICVASSHAADIVSAEAPEKVLDIAKGFGSAKLVTSSDGDPKISGRMNGTRYSVYFNECEDGKTCDDIVFSAGWTGYKTSINDMNDWNKGKRFGTAYIDSDKDPVLQMTVNLRYGVTEKNLDDWFDWWGVVMGEFEEEVLEGAAAEAPTLKPR